MGFGLTNRRVSFAAILALVYAAFGIIWIAASDTVLAALVSDPIHLTAIQTWKGWVFVAASAVLIYGVGARLLRVIEDSEKRYRMLFADSPEALALYDPAALRMVEANAAFGRMFGYEPAEACGLHLSELMPPETLQALEREIPRLISGQKAGGVWRMRCKDGRPLDISTHGQMVDVEGRNLRLVQVTDVTARLRAEYELLRTMEGLATANARMRDLSHALSHDLQEPLRQVSGFVQLLAKRYHGQLDGEAHQFIAFAVEGIHRLKTLIDDVESFALSSAFIPASVAAGQVVGEVLEGLRAVMDAANATVTVGNMPRVLADPGKLAVIFHALLDNAIKFHHAARPPVVLVDCERKDGVWLFRVSDNGIGIEPEFREGVFSLFSRLHTRDRIPGNGAGLALARKLVEAHGGRIWVEAGTTEGATFCFTLPEDVLTADGPAKGVPVQEAASQH
ncbi:MAG: PAS domain S-box protein [Rhodospirillaceae bacterium]|nr:PAS domain S-box protein [Rhodospirillales bacterium]